MLRAVVLGLCMLVSAGTARAEPVLRVIANAKNPVTRVDRHFLVDAFLKKRSRWDDDRPIEPVDLPQQSAVREKFTHDMLGRDVAAVRRYWAQLVFSGRGVPPPELETEAEIVKYVAGHAGAIGYVSGTGALDGVKVLEIEGS
jgi:ABC-type phosphate transport system substrate-binding protein